MCVGIRGEDGKCVLARGFVEEGAADVRGQSSQLEAVSLVWHPVELEIRPLSLLPIAAQATVRGEPCIPFFIGRLITCLFLLL